MENTEPKKRTGAVKKSSPAKKETNENSVARYLRETRGEMRKVTWPTREEAMRLTWIVMVFTGVFALFLGLLDYLWSTVLQELIRFLVGG